MKATGQKFLKADVAKIMNELLLNSVSHGFLTQKLQLWLCPLQLHCSFVILYGVGACPPKAKKIFKKISTVGTGREF